MSDTRRGPAEVIEPGVTMQISLAPTDLPTAIHTLPHQIRVWGPQVDEIVFALDLHRSPGRYGEAWEERLPGMRRLLEEICSADPKARLVEVDYSEASRSAMAETYAGGKPIPVKDCFGAPFYAYLFGINAARYRLVLHLDSDMLYGGCSPTWMSEARAVLDRRPEIITVSPLPGPPTADGTLRSQVLEPEADRAHAFMARSLSTRNFIVDRDKLRDLLLPLTMSRPNWRRTAGAWFDGHPPVRPLEEHFSARMEAQGLWRLDFLGDSPGMWSVHPAFKTPHFFAMLPSLISEMERGEIHDSQRGHHDLVDDLVDSTEARTTRLQRLGGHFSLGVRRIVRVARDDDERLVSIAAPEPSATGKLRLLTVISAGIRRDREHTRRLEADDLHPRVLLYEDRLGSDMMGGDYLEHLPRRWRAIVGALPVSLGQALAAFSMRHQYDVIITWNPPISVLFAALLKLGAARTKHVAIMYAVSAPEKRELLRLVQDRVDALITHSSVQRDLAVDRIGMPASKVHLLAHWVDQQFWRPLPVAVGDGICAAGNEMRDYATLVEALSGLQLQCHIAVREVSKRFARWRGRNRTLVSLGEVRSASGRPQNLTIEAFDSVGLRGLYARSRFVVVPLLPTDRDN
ncbi:MAG TPA: hypothetical protein VG015_06285, partial [Candidatus Dormibacteraeota bacterium]|nr:hypothetical protein [Candidatus Dormibacteraeota bacterium]